MAPRNGRGKPLRCASHSALMIVDSLSAIASRLQPVAGRSQGPGPHRPPSVFFGLFFSFFCFFLGFFGFRLSFFCFFFGFFCFFFGFFGFFFGFFGFASVSAFWSCDATFGLSFPPRFRSFFALSHSVRLLDLAFPLLLLPVRCALLLSGRRRNGRSRRGRRGAGFRARAATSHEECPGDQSRCPPTEGCAPEHGRTLTPDAARAVPAPWICYPRASRLLPSCYMERRTGSSRLCAVMRGYAPKTPANQLVPALSCDVLRSSQTNGHGWFRTTDLSRVKRALSH
jgi:hypothetical protein